MSIKSIVDQIIEAEGGFVHHSADRGGATHYGITQKTLGSYRGSPASIDDVRNLTREEAEMIYRERYITKPGYEHLASSQLMALVVDSAVLHGTRRTNAWLQGIVEVKQDGIIGAISLRAINNSDPTRIYQRLLAIRLRFIGRIITRDHRQAVFAAGWMARLANFVEQ